MLLANDGIGNRFENLVFFKERTKITTKYRISYKYWFFVTFGAANMLKGFIYGL
mgnify:CR=1 FL=1